MATRLLRICGSSASSSFSVLRENSLSFGNSLTQPLRFYATNRPGGSGNMSIDRATITGDLGSFKKPETLIDPDLVPKLAARNDSGGKRARGDEEEENKSETVDVMLDRPKSLAYFNKLVPFAELITALDLCVKKYTSHSPLYKKKPLFEELKKAKDRYVPWGSITAMCKHVGLNLTETQYNSIIARLDQLVGDSKDDLHRLPKDLQTYLEGFTRTGKLAHEVRAEKTLDKLGRAYAAGRRKEAAARVWLIKGEGEIFINARPLASYFARLVDREQVLLPFVLTSTLAKYNAWVLTIGGGTTGQSGAIRLGLSKALAIHEPHLHPILEKAGLLRRDPRQVERKKTGRPKARKGFTWVKR